MFSAPTCALSTGLDHRRIGIVSQETYLFHATVRENLRYARPDATDAEIEDACRARTSTTSIASFEAGTTPSWASAVTACRAERSNASRSRACC